MVKFITSIPLVWYSEYINTAMAKYTNNKDSDWIYIIGSNAME